MATERLELDGEEESRDEDVRLGLRKKCRCKLCEHEFFVERLPGVISYNRFAPGFPLPLTIFSILKLRESWGYLVNYPGPSTLYKPERICVFCSQFFSHLVSDDEIQRELERKTRVRTTKKKVKRKPRRRRRPRKVD